MFQKDEKISNIVCCERICLLLHVIFASEDDIYLFPVVEANSEKPKGKTKNKYSL